MAEFNAIALLCDDNMENQFLNLANTKKANDKVAAGKIAPGDTGVFKVGFDLTHVETAADYEIGFGIADKLVVEVPGILAAYMEENPQPNIAAYMEFKYENSDVSRGPLMSGSLTNLADVSEIYRKPSKEIKWSIKDAEWDARIDAYMHEIYRTITDTKGETMTREKEEAMDHLRERLINMEFINEPIIVLVATVTQRTMPV